MCDLILLSDPVGAEEVILTKRGWTAPTQLAGVLWDLFDKSPEVFGSSIDNFLAIRCELELAQQAGELSDGVAIADVLKRLDAINNKSSVPREVLTRAEAMEYLRIGSDKLFELTEPVGPIPARRDGNRIYYWLDDLREYAKSGIGAQL